MDMELGHREVSDSYKEEYFLKWMISLTITQEISS
jgi:hypothetical protein